MLIERKFIIPGNTKNICDGKFGLTKRRSRQKYALVTSNVMKVIKDSFKMATCVTSRDVAWKNWKEFFKAYFKIPPKMNTNQYYVISFGAKNPGEVQVKYLFTKTVQFSYKLAKMSSRALVSSTAGLTGMLGSTGRSSIQFGRKNLEM